MPPQTSRTDSVVLLTLEEAATFLRTSVATLRYWRHLGIGPAGFRLGRRVVYQLDELQRWILSQRDADAERRRTPELH
jgi:hypothetical protein